ncbi:uncharacterized protein LOC110942640 [Helianthus annuus]|uniref:uncharacterized protein LOC110942640 n=1 Tax=Helianthus annuus TaxID=4232 RepID=UPI001652CE8E|nr:uncharacterized protein LOC110942640 [Helianthus annuus]
MRSEKSEKRENSYTVCIYFVVAIFSFPVLCGAEKMRKRLKQVSSSSPGLPNHGVNNECLNIPLSNITNVDEGRRRRKLRKIYLDNKKSRSTSTPTNTQLNIPASFSLQVSTLAESSLRTPLSNITNVVEAKHRHKLRKLYLDGKRSSITRKPFPSKGEASSSSGRLIIFTDKENLPPNSSITTFCSDFNSSGNLTSSMITRSTLKNGFVPQDSYTTPQRTPFANKENVIPGTILNFAGKATSSSRAFLNLNSKTNVLQESSTSTQRTQIANKENITPASYNIASSSTLPLNDCYSISPRIVNKRNASSFITEVSSLKKMSSGKRRLIHKPIEIEPIPMTDLDSDDVNHVHECVIDITKGTSIDYLDHGDQSLTCGICYGKLWPTEGGKGQITLEQQTYGLCCGYGKVDLPDYKDSDPAYQMLFLCSDSEKISGQNAHSLGSLLPKPGNKPKFSQLYIYDTENELLNRTTLFGDSTTQSSSKQRAFDVKFIKYLTDMLDSHNMLVKTYRMVRNHIHENPNVSLKLRLISQRDRDGRTYNLPTSSEIAALIVGDMDKTIDHRDIIVKEQSGVLKRISELHPSYLALQYPILFPYGDDGYRINIPHRDFGPNTKKTRPNCTMREFFAYRIQDRDNKFSLILNARSLKKVQEGGQSDLSHKGKPVILPSSFTGGYRYIMQNYLDAMALCRTFIGDSSIKPEDRPDILCRLFKMELDALIKDMKEKKIFGDINAVVYTVEFQKRGLTTHAHICLFMKADHKLPIVEHIDPFISTEIPDKNENPELYSLVSDFMIHGPCGHANLKCPCMVGNRSKNFPKRFMEATYVGSCS